MVTAYPVARPARPNFSSGPCAKRPGWNPKVFKAPLLGARIASKIGKARLKLAIDLTREVLAGARRLPHRHRAGVRYRRGRNGAVVAARRAASTCSPGNPSAKAGSAISSSS